MDTENENEFDLSKDSPAVSDTFDVTPLVDVAFLLLIFFMMTAKVGMKSDVEQPRALTGDAVQSSRVVIILAKTSPVGDALLYRGDSTAEANQIAGDLKTQEDEIQRYIEHEVVQRPEIIGIVIKGDKRLKQKYVAMISRAATAGGGGRPLYIGVDQD